MSPDGRKDGHAQTYIPPPSAGDNMPNPVRNKNEFVTSPDNLCDFLAKRVKKALSSAGISVPK